jgi:hypothetical protein
MPAQAQIQILLYSNEQISRVCHREIEAFAKSGTWSVLKKILVPRYVAMSIKASAGRKAVPCASLLRRPARCDSAAMNRRHPFKMDQRLQ